VVTIVNRLGLHARAASKLVHTASSYASKVSLSRDGHHVDAKSIMGDLLHCGTLGTRIEVEASGPDAEEAVAAIAALVADRFGEVD
jgi:phosphocarrier protein